MNLRDELSDRQRPSDPELDNDQVDPEEPGEESGGEPVDPPDSAGDPFTDP